MVAIKRPRWAKEHADYLTKNPNKKLRALRVSAVNYSLSLVKSEPRHPQSQRFCHKYLIPTGSGVWNVMPNCELRLFFKAVRSGLSNELIHSLTGLPLKTIEKIRKEIEKQPSPKQ